MRGAMTFINTFPLLSAFLLSLHEWLNTEAESFQITVFIVRKRSKQGVVALFSCIFIGL
jgi:hypothetical protein